MSVAPTAHAGVTRARSGSFAEGLALHASRAAPPGLGWGMCGWGLASTPPAWHRQGWVGGVVEGTEPSTPPVELDLSRGAGR
jgi:hypothetical protein